jgi:cytochrome d ubiquinol oxidase subunit I
MLKGRRDRHHRLGLLIPLTVALIASPIQFYFGDLAARKVADHQPAKFAGMECIYKTGTDQAEHIGGICTDGEVKGGITIPGFDSWLVGFSTDTKVTGLDSFPAKNRPPANTLLHLAFDFMVGIGSAFIALGLWVGFVWWRKRDIPKTDWFLRIVSVCGIAAVLTLWSGWIVTEVGRQPWIVQGYQRTADAVTPAGGIWFAFAAVLLLYAALGTVAILVIRKMAARWREGGEVTDEGAPYAPPVSGAAAGTGGGG